MVVAYYLSSCSFITMPFTLFLTTLNHWLVRVGQVRTFYPMKLGLPAINAASLRWHAVFTIQRLEIIHTEAVTSDSIYLQSLYCFT